MEIKRITHQDTWPIRHQVMWPDKPIDYIKLTEDPQGLHFGLWIDNQIVSIVSAFIDNNEAQFRKFATLEEEQGKGYGSQLLAYLFEELSRLGVKRIWCNARLKKTTFYERFGMIKTNQYFSRGEVEYVIMEKKGTQDDTQ
ncbi:MAG: GNAT family N-acetyltransferase [Saprospiraceae bacterium]|nr:GNAT family N-acetyltransferase [Saprospiraceae bacterium]